MVKKLSTALLSVFLIFMSSTNVFAAGNISKGTFDLLIDVYEFGPNVTKVIVTLENPIDEINKSQLQITERKLATNFATFETGVFDYDKVLKDVYVSDSKGNKISTSSKYFTVEFDVHPKNGSLLYYDLSSGHNMWSDPYNLLFSLKDGESLLSEGNIIDTLQIKETASNIIFDEANAFTYHSFTDNNITLQYGSYKPATTSGKSPLIIWLHGAGEGGTDSTINTLGNKVPALISEEIQGYYNGAYVLTPQTSTMWMDDGTGNYTEDGYSMYTESLMKLIQEYVKANPNIDTDRIYIGGCSNGGYMTMNMLFEYPSYFAAAFPICQAYKDEWITDDMLDSIKNIPIWFTHAGNDTTVPYEAYTKSTYERLKTIGADAHLSYFEDIHDTTGLYLGDDGQPYQYMGHFAWIPVLNNDCEENGVKMFKWLSTKSLTTEENVTTIPEGTSPPKTGVEDNTMVFITLLGLSFIVLSSYIYRKKQIKA